MAETKWPCMHLVHARLFLLTAKAQPANKMLLDKVSFCLLQMGQQAYLPTACDSKVIEK